jgi:hypothetical protein
VARSAVVPTRVPGTPVSVSADGGAAVAQAGITVLTVPAATPSRPPITPSCAAADRNPDEI